MLYPIGRSYRRLHGLDRGTRTRRDIYPWLDRFFEGEDMELTFPHETVDSVDKYLIRIEVPGVGLGDLSVAVVNNNSISVSGQKKRTVSGTINSSITYGYFNKSFDVPGTVDTDSIDACLKDGILTISMNKKVNDSKIEIKQG